MFIKDIHFIKGTLLHYQRTFIKEIFDKRFYQIFDSVMSALVPRFESGKSINLI